MFSDILLSYNNYFLAGEVHGTSKVRPYPVVQTTAFSGDNYSSIIIETGSDM
jgi:hypothetical protein